jgi:hypothetical protein
MMYKYIIQIFLDLLKNYKNILPIIQFKKINFIN